VYIASHKRMQILAYETTGAIADCSLQGINLTWWTSWAKMFLITPHYP